MTGISLIPITPSVAIAAAELPEHHKDPQDRIIIATALTHGGFLMSSDHYFSQYEEIVDRLL